MAQHISIRVPWHDNNWNGKICKNPKENTSCMVLKNIYENKKAEEEMENINKKLDCIKCPCISEGAGFMSNTSLQKTTIHPYAKNKNNKTHSHFRETIVEYPEYSIPSVPYALLMKDNIKKKKDIYNIKYNEENEPILDFKSEWVQDARNHRAIFDYFYKNVEKNKSLCLIYAKQVPFVDDNRRVIIGIGTVKAIIPAKEHEYDPNSKNELRSMTWETMIKHSIRENCEEGFIFPYKKMMEYANTHPEFDIRDITVFAPDEAFDEFSYASEHVNHDTVINIILSSIKSFNKIKEYIDGPWDNCIKWLNQKLEEVWIDRGIFPGVGPLLCSMKFKYGMVIAKELKEKYDNKTKYFDFVDKVIKEQKKYLTTDIEKSITETVKNTYLTLKPQRKELLKLLSRFTLNIEQANILFNNEQREKYGISCTDEEIIENPYILYEKTRLLDENKKISIKTIDIAMFPKKEVKEKYINDNQESKIAEDDKTRIRAIIIDILESNSEKGHTILPTNELILTINDMSMEHKIEINQDTLDSIEEYLKEEIKIIENKNKKYYKLNRYQEIDELIADQVNKRIRPENKHKININWTEKLNQKFGIIEDKNEEKARKEKAEALKILAESRLSVLIGGAGTGKTTVLSVLCQEEQIKNGGVLLLAPTGKARVRMQETIGEEIQAYTIAQYLIKSKRYDPKTGKYRLTSIKQENVPNTVIIDESSMLTEEMFGALLQAIKSAKRIIFVGDPNQLPPIGAGRPFVDLVRYLNKGIPKNKFPYTANSFAKLKITRRQKEENRIDVELSKWFMQEESDLDDSVFEKMEENKEKYIKFKKYDTQEELENLILQTIVEETNMNNIDDINKFNISLGAVSINGNTYFNLPTVNNAVENWQILAPVRNMPQGVRNINEFIHNKYRKKEIEATKNKKIKPLGPEKIVYSDKVINTKNEKRNAWPENGANYIANGEIGIAGNINSKQYLQVEFSTQKGYRYSYNKKDISEDKEFPLELAYALTIHKAQGSQFKKVILVIQEPCRLISKEMIYTALTRQTEKLIIIYNKRAFHLKDYSLDRNTEIAKRYTNLFELPEIVKVQDTYYEEKLIHRTVKGELVRSKSEVIIANLLNEKDIDYEYEKPLFINNTMKLPDFTIEDSATGKTIYWEHCGMINDEKYKKKWEEKKKIYEENGIIENKNLIVTYDKENGAIDSKEIEEKIEKELQKLLL